MDNVYQYEEGIHPEKPHFIPTGGKVITNPTVQSIKPDTSKLEHAGCVFSVMCGHVEVLSPISYDEDGAL
ncbi:MAG: hypothetical protein GX800_10935 [Clostridiaceae bacterium]|jgi:hypothetical protein|nr:hypothetical protein [Clostridiaceae bacterium]